VSEEGQPAPTPLMVAPFTLESLRQADGGSPGAPPPPPPPPSRRERREDGSHRRHRRRGRRWLVALLVLALVVVAAGLFAAVRLSAPDPAPTVTSVLHHTVDLASTPVSLPWPQTGQAAVAIPSIGVDMASAPEKPQPVASLTKLMTAYVILHDHPLKLGQLGPSITVTQADVNDYNEDTVSDNSNAQVAVGEQIPEVQVLGGLLIHSADNYADLLARWDAGSEAAFVAKMNKDAAQLGMVQSHFADPSGVDPGSQSTPYDLLKVTSLDMTDPVFAALVQQSSITLPVAGTISTYTPLLGVDGVIGVKSGFTTAAGGCDVLAVERPVHGVPTLLLAAVTGQQGPAVLAQAGLHGLALVSAMTPLVGATAVLHQGAVVAHVSEAGKTVSAQGAAPVSLLTWPGAKATMVFHPDRHLTDRARRGAVVGSVDVSMGTQHATVRVRLQQDVPQPTMAQRLF
jgi:serine-type D-Ala-D-Ala carboxypeptidase (penicillin-binding protein 5/6)